MCQSKYKYTKKFLIVEANPAMFMIMAPHTKGMGVNLTGEDNKGKKSDILTKVRSYGVLINRDVI